MCAFKRNLALRVRIYQQQQKKIMLLRIHIFLCVLNLLNDFFYG